MPLEGVFGLPFNVVGRSNTKEPYDGRGWLPVSPGYFGLLNIPVLHGREFNDQDGVHARLVAVVNQTLANRFWSGSSALGNRLLLGKGFSPELEESSREIVGVVGDVLDFDGNAKRPVVYVPIAQVNDGGLSLLTRASSLVWLTKTVSEPHSFAKPVEQALQQATAGIPVTSVMSMGDMVVESTARANFQTALLTLFGAVALVLAGIGIYGIASYSVHERTKEIGVRMALGADPKSVRNMLVHQSMRYAVWGMFGGLSAALVVSRWLESELFMVKAWDPLTLAIVATFLMSTLFIAVWLPSHRVMKVDPTMALRHE